MNFTHNSVIDNKIQSIIISEKSRKIINVKCIPPHGCDGFPHFAHVMEYFYYATSIILNYPESFIIINEPYQYYKSPYVNSFIMKLINLLKDRFILVKHNFEYPLEIYKTYEFFHNKHIIKDTFYQYNDNVNLQHKHDYYKWFIYNNSNIMRDLFLPDTHNNSQNKVLIINRLKTRRFRNMNDIENLIKNNFNLEYTIEYFENIDFNKQIEAFKKHNIIIAPHGAALTNTPFSPDNAIIIECCHDEWHPYYYFPGLSISCIKHHALICNTPSVFPQWYTDDYKCVNNKKLDINADISKIKLVIDLYLNNSFKEHKCYLF